MKNLSIAITEKKAAADRAEALKLILTPPCLLETEPPAAAPNSEYFDPKERSKERKKNVEMNRTDDKRSNAMAALKAKREGKQKREEEEAKRQAEREGNEDLDGGMYSIGNRNNYYITLRWCRRMKLSPSPPSPLRVSLRGMAFEGAF